MLALLFCLRWGARSRPPNLGSVLARLAKTDFDRAISQDVMHHLIEQRLAEIAVLCRRYGVRQLEVFGSAARAQDFDPATSDADFLVDFQSGVDLGPLEQFFGLADALARLLGRPVDLVERGAVRNPFVLAGINRARVVVYAA